MRPARLPTTRRGAFLTVAKLAVLAALGSLTAIALLPTTAGGAHDSKSLVTEPTRIITTTILAQFYTVTVAVTGNGSVTSSPSGINCGSTCSALFTRGTTVTLTPQPGSVLSEFTGWGGACSGTGTCTVSSGAAVTASFGVRSIVTTIPITIPKVTLPSTFSLNLATNGSGTVTSSPSGITCGAVCTAAFSLGTSVTLHASPSSGYEISSWSGGGCSGTSPTCTVSAGGTVTVTFSLVPTGSTTNTTTSSSQPVIVATPTTTTTIVAPTPLLTLTVGVSGTGSVTGKAPGASAAIACGAEASRCFGTFKPGAKVTLHAAPAKGFTFTGWSGGCTGRKSTCTLEVSRASKVSAHFAAKPSAAIVPLELSSAAFSVKWNASVGTGKLMLHGRIAKTAQVEVELDRSNGQKLVSEHLSLPAGAFSLALKLDPGLGLLPGGFVVSISGKSGDLTVPPQLKTLTLAAPPGGVVGRAFASSSEHGGPSSTLRSPKQAFVTFDFTAQPKSNQKLTISWFEPNGKLLGTATKPSGPTVTSSIKSNAALPRGAWRVDLRSGGTLVRSLAVNVS